MGFKLESRSAAEERAISAAERAVLARTGPGPDLPRCAVCRQPLAQSWGYGVILGEAEGLFACSEHRSQVEAMAERQTRAAA